MNKKLVAHQNMREFDPECERHFPLISIKMVEPGCTSEIQIENAITGTVQRYTTTDNPEADLLLFEEAILSTFRTAFKSYSPNVSM